MDPISLATAGALFVVTSVVRKAGDELIDETWASIKRGFKRLFGREPDPNSISVDAVKQVVAADSELDAAISRLWAGSNVLRRAKVVAPVLNGARVLWIDDHPAWNISERECLRALGVQILTVESTQSAIDSLRGESFNLMISDVDREGSPTAGLDALPELGRVAPTIPVILYVGSVRPGVPTGAFGITARPDELLHLCMDALERHRA